MMEAAYLSVVGGASLLPLITFEYSLFSCRPKQKQSQQLRNISMSFSKTFFKLSARSHHAVATFHSAY
jgi:hypothetical protein